MSFEYSFNPHDRIRTDEVLSWNKPNLEVPLIKKLETKGPISDWQKKQREKHDETVILLDGGSFLTRNLPHTVAWVRRYGKGHYSDNGYDYCQLVCDCSVELEGFESNEALMCCSAVAQAIKIKSEMIRKEREFDKLIGVHKIEGEKPDSRAYRILYSPTNPVLKTLIFDVVRETFKNPRTWMANLTERTHRASVISLIFELEKSDTVKVLNSMVKDKSIELHNDEVITLNPLEEIIV